MITIIYGQPRSGKTALMTKLALEYMTGENAVKDIRQSCKLIKKFNDGGFKLSYPQKHLVFSDYEIWTRNKTLFSWYASGYSFGLPNKQYNEIGFYPPCSRLFFDEAQKYWNSRESNKLSDFVSRAFELHGHFKYNIYIAVQRLKLIDLNIRELSPCILEVVSMRNVEDNGLVMSSTWTCRKYDSFAEAEKHINGEKSKYRTVHYRFDGNIFRHYESEGHRYAFMRGRAKSDFDYKANGGYGYTVADVERFNKEHDYTVPENFQKGGSKK